MLVLGYLFALPTAAIADGLSVDDWYLSCSAYGPASESTFAFFETVQSPFAAAHSVSLTSSPATRAAAQYDISWMMDYGSFNISSQLAAQDGHSVRSQATGTIYLQADTDLAFSVDALLNYNLPTWGVASYLSFTVWDITAAQYAYRNSVWDDTFLGAPVSDTLTIASDFTLPASHQCRIQYDLRLDTYGYSAGLPTGNGHVNFTITPEPATLALLGPLLLTPRRRTNRPQRAPSA